MHPLSVLILFVSCWALMNFWLVPLLHSSWSASDLLGKVKRTATLTLLEKARDLAGVGAITMGVLTVAVGIVALLGEGSAISTKSMMEALSAAYRAVEGFARGYAQFLVWFGVIAGSLALYVCSRNARRRVTEAWRTDAERLRTQLQDDPAAWDSLREEPQYRSRIQRLDELKAMLATESSTQEQRTGAALEAVELLNELAAEKSRTTLDLERTLAGHEAPEMETDRPKSKLLPLLGVIAGPRLTRDLGLVGRYLSLLVVALLLTALVGWSAAPLANSLRVTVNELRVAALTDEVERQIDQAIASIEPPEPPPIDPLTPPSPNETTTLARATRLVAQAAVHQIQNSGLLDPSRGGSATASRAEFVRNAILDRRLGYGNSVATNLRRNVAEGFANAGRPPVAGDRLTEQLNGGVRDLLDRIHERNPKAVDRIVDRVTRRYLTSLNPLDVQGSLITRLVSVSFGLADVNPSDELAKVATNLASDVGKSAVSEWANLHARAIVADGLIGAEAKAAVVQRLQSGEWLERSQRNSTLVRDLRLARGQGWRPSAAEGASESASSKVAKAVADRYEPASQRAIQRTLEGYSSAFPRVVQAAGNAAQASNAATDFVKAMRSPRIRGVIFGRPVRPEFRLSDIAWEIDTATQGPTLVTLHLVVDDRDEVLGPFAAGVLNQALRFAADQRVVATTITPGDRHVISRITSLHPVLEDTPLGCRIVEIDRVIDAFTSAPPDEGDANPFAGQLTEVHRQRVAALRFLRSSVAAEAAASAGSRCQPQRLGFQEAETSPAAAIAIHADEARQLFRTLREGQYSTALVDSALECGIQNTMPVAQCLCENAAQVDLSQPYWFPEDHTSQVRERDVTDVRDFHSLFRPIATSDHIELWLHTTFAIRQRGEIVDDDSETAALDFPREQIDSLNRILLPAAVAAYAKDNLGALNYEDFIAPIEQFVLVQRFMRAALSGQFGDAFPIEKLVDLERATAEFVPSQPTIRWEAANEELFMAVLRESGDAAKTAYTKWILDMSDRLSGSLPSCDAAAH